MTEMLRAGTMVLAAVAVASPSSAQEDGSWTITAELTAVWTAGNAESNALGAEGKVTRSWARSELKLEAGAIRAQSTKTTRRAVGTTASFTVSKTEVSEKTAEAFFARGRYDYRFSSRVFVFGGVDWLRNQFAGIDSRFLLAAGLGATILDGEHLKLKADASGTYTFQRDVVANPFDKTKFPGVRAGYDLRAQVTNTTTISSVAVADFNLDNTDDVRVDWTNAVQIAISSRLAFKPSLQVLWRNAPSLADVELFDINNAPTGQSVSVPLQKIDSLFKVALVVNF